MEDRNNKTPENKERNTSTRRAEPINPLKDRMPGRGEDRTAEMNGKKGEIETEHTRPTGKTSAIPGNSSPDAKRIDKEGTAASGAGLGGNKGTGTRSKKDFS
jgi:hypothetical protein